MNKVASTRERVIALLDRIATRTPTIGAIVATCPDTALTEADRVDAARAAGRPLPLDGLTVVVKDNIDVAGLPSACGSPVFAERVATSDATVVRRLREAGAVLLGKAQSTEFMYALTPHPSLPPCRNPWALDRIAGASSNGSGAALADGQADGALGTDTGGSVRVPAAYTGTTGLRPTFGVVPMAGVYPLAFSADVVGPMARSAGEVARLFDVLADPGPRRTWDAESARLGVPRQFFFDGCDPRIESATRTAIDELRRFGHPVVEVDLTLAGAAHAASTLLVRAEAYALHRHRLDADLSDNLRNRLLLAETVTRQDIALALADIAAWRDQLRRAFESVDVILSPTSPCVPPLLTEANLAKVGDVTRLPYPWGAAHIPALSLPCGRTDDGLPIGLHAASAWHTDRSLLAFATHIQERTDWHRAEPAR